MKEKLANKMIVSAIIALLIILMAACAGSQEASVTVPPGAQAGDLVGLEPCSYALKAGMFSSVEYAADCGTLVVPENRADPNSRLIAVPVIRIRATGDNPAEPIFRLLVDRA